MFCPHKIDGSLYQKFPSRIHFLDENSSTMDQSFFENIMLGINGIVTPYQEYSPEVPMRGGDHERTNACRNSIQLVE